MHTINTEKRTRTQLGDRIVVNLIAIVLQRSHLICTYERNNNNSQDVGDKKKIQHVT